MEATIKLSNGMTLDQYTDEVKKLTVRLSRKIVNVNKFKTLESRRKQLRKIMVEYADFMMLVGLSFEIPSDQMTEDEYRKIVTQVHASCGAVTAMYMAAVCLLGKQKVVLSLVG